MRWLLLPLLLVSCAASSVAPLRPVALRLTFEDGTCSGTAVGPQLVLTATHCFGRLTHINGQPAYALRRVDDGKDHSLVKVNVRFGAWARRGAPPEQGDRLRWLGNPGGLENVYREGYVATVIDGASLLDAQVFQGDSGSGVFNESGQLVGVVSGAKVLRSQLLMQLAWLEPMRFTDKQWRAAGAG